MTEFFITRYASTAFPMARYLKENYPQVEEAVAIHAYFSGEGKYQDKIIPFKGHYTSSEFFKIFDFELIGADPEHVLDEPYSVVMREELARKFFGDEDPIGKTILVDTIKEFTKKHISNMRFWLQTIRWIKIFQVTGKKSLKIMPILF
jgi:hypothetical protein